MGRNNLCVVVTLIVSVVTTLSVGVTVFSDHWERVTYPRANVLRQLFNHSQVEAIFENRGIVVHLDEKEPQILVHMHSGLWAICLDLSQAELELLMNTFPQLSGTRRCLNDTLGQAMFLGNKREEDNHDVNYDLKESEEKQEDRAQQRRSSRRHIRMHNLSVSCSVVSLILLCVCLLVLLLGLLGRHVPPVLVVSVLYLLAAIFALFSLCIAKYRWRGADLSLYGPLDAHISRQLLSTRKFSADWAIFLGWFGVAGCVVAAICAYTLARIMRTTTVVKP